MLIDIPKTYIETDTLNYLTYSGNYYPGRNLFDDGHIVLHENDGTERKCYKNLDLTIPLLEDIILDLYSYFAQQGAYGFCLLREVYLININNTHKLHLKSFQSGEFLVQAEFKNGQTLDIYKGKSEEYANELIQEYRNAENRLNERLTNEEQIKETL